MKRFLIYLALLLALSPPVSAQPTVNGGQSPSRVQSYDIVFSAGDTTDSPAIGVSGFCSVRYQQSGGDDVSLYAVTSAGSAASSGTLIGAFTASTTAATTFTAGTRWVKAVATDATAGGSVMTIECAPLTGRGVNTDPDGDGLYDVATLWDSDGDGTVWKTCTAKDTPDPRCKVAGERIWDDAADDINCAVWGCGFGQMENYGTLYLDTGVYALWPCYDQRRATAAERNDPGPANENNHDATSDSAYTNCPATPDPDTARRFIAISLMDWQGEIIGSGTDSRNPLTTDNYARTQGTYLVNDMGPTWLTGTGGNAGLNSWFGQSSFVRGITFGFESGFNSTTDAVANSGEYSGDGDSSGYTVAIGTQLIDAMNSSLCVCESTTCGASANNFVSSLQAGDVIEIKASSQVAGGSSSTVLAAVRILGTPSSSECDGGGGDDTASIALGGSVNGANNTDATYAGVDIPYAYQVTDDFLVTHARSDYLDSTARVANLNVEPQDYWDETSGDCGEASTSQWDYTVDSGQSDIDCDTNPLFGFFGAGRPVVENVVIRNWHDFAFDGASNAGNPLARHIRFFYGRGGAVADYGTGWNIEDWEVRDTSFRNSSISTFGPGLFLDGLRFYNTRANNIAIFGEFATGNYFRNIRAFNSSFTNHFVYNCGARFNTVEDFQIWNPYGRGTVTLNGLVARMECATTSTPIEGNVINGVTLTGSGIGAYAGPSNQSIAAVVLDTNATVATPGTAAIVNNLFSQFNMKVSDADANIEACLFAAQDDAVANRAGDYSHEDVLAVNRFYGNSVRNTGGGADFVYCGCGVQDGTPPSSGSNGCDQIIFGGGAGGANPRGCMNADGTAKPANETCD